MNALVLRLQPQPAIFLTTNMKTPGFSEKPVSTHMGVDYGDSKIPDAYTRLLLDVLRGQQANFVRDDELVAAWEIFTPLLDQLEHMPPVLYEKGSTGPKEREDYLRAVFPILTSCYYLFSRSTTPSSTTWTRRSVLPRPFPKYAMMMRFARATLAFRGRCWRTAIAYTDYELLHRRGWLTT